MALMAFPGFEDPDEEIVDGLSIRNRFALAA